MFKNMVGLEAEFFLRNEQGELVYPGTYGFETDDFILIGELRAAPGESVADTIANFMRAYYQVVQRAKSNNLVLDITGQASITPAEYSSALRKRERKNVSSCKNIYPEIDILSLSDAIIKNGKVLEQRLSCGLHVHFSSNNVVKKSIELDKTQYEPVDLPLGIGKANTFLHLFRQTKRDVEKHEIEAVSNLITKPVVNHIVKEFDNRILLQFVQSKPPLKYRNAGFYEIKSYGFEYRSLPFNQTVLSQIDQIVEFAFAQLNDLSCA